MAPWECVVSDLKIIVTSGGKNLELGRRVQSAASGIGKSSKIIQLDDYELPIYTRANKGVNPKELRALIDDLEGPSPWMVLLPEYNGGLPGLDQCPDMDFSGLCGLQVAIQPKEDRDRNGQRRSWVESPRCYTGSSSRTLGQMWSAATSGMRRAPQRVRSPSWTHCPALVCGQIIANNAF